MQLSAWVVIVVACYLAALGLELLGLKRRFAGRRAAIAGLALAGFLVQSYILATSFATEPLPLASPAEWLLVAAWALALVYLAAILYLPQTPSGIVLLPVALGLIAASLAASHEPFAPERTYYFWGLAHGVLLLLGTVSMCVGFLTGLLYLWQSVALKRAATGNGAWRLPSLEWLERVNSRSLAVSTVLILLGFASGLVLSVLKQRHDSSLHYWTDPVVQISAAMLLWLIAAEAFRLIYPAARQGRKVAYLTLASFAFVVAVVLVLSLVESGHGL
jgi:ABC-type uncharacterized transport system permease subunit